MTNTSHPLHSVVSACAPLRFAPLPQLPGLDGTDPGSRAGDGLPRPDVSSPATAPPHWYRAAGLAEAAVLGPLYDKLRAEHGPDHRLAAVHRFLRSLLREPIFLVSAGTYLTGRAPLLSPTHLWLPWQDNARFDTPVVTDPRIAVLPDDPYAGHPDTITVADVATRDQWAARHLVAACAPIVAGVHEHTRMNKRNLWGWVVDTVYFYMLNPARFLGHDARQAWAQATRLADEIARAGAVLRERPRLFPFCESHPQGTWAVRSTCCFDYKADPEHGYCVTCPLRDDASRQAELMDWIRTPALSP
ncbi:(2Fe-2S)-binding protein [Lipingzhangella sp. LS1_29]|uniref:(2Fe-2S)-binding protein n=1 Tax=Lipingzhangella rawalii TaxID=2055835 RepID=A0ABU2H1R0_9ACTN|nr:(2Fe-2S)-binding protein [Lipingzhangella rawalii]MDS1269231.1 (2Fe-2S)-binding protein [Lipingzhangella rawalii]